MWCCCIPILYLIKNVILYFGCFILFIPTSLRLWVPCFNVNNNAIWSIAAERQFPFSFKWTFLIRKITRFFFFFIYSFIIGSNGHYLQFPLSRRLFVTLFRLFACCWCGRFTISIVFSFIAFLSLFFRLLGHRTQRWVVNSLFLQQLFLTRWFPAMITFNWNPDGKRANALHSFLLFDQSFIIIIFALWYASIPCALLRASSVEWLRWMVNSSCSNVNFLQFSVFTNSHQFRMGIDVDKCLRPKEMIALRRTWNMNPNWWFNKWYSK